MSKAMPQEELTNDEAMQLAERYSPVNRLKRARQAWVQNKEALAAQSTRLEATVRIHRNVRSSGRVDQWDYGIYLRRMSAHFRPSFTRWFKDVDPKTEARNNHVDNIIQAYDNALATDAMCLQDDTYHSLIESIRDKLPEELKRMILEFVVERLSGEVRLACVGNLEVLLQWMFGLDQSKESEAFHESFLNILFNKTYINVEWLHPQCLSDSYVTSGKYVRGSAPILNLSTLTSNAWLHQVKYISLNREQIVDYYAYSLRLLPQQKPSHTAVTQYRFDKLVDTLQHFTGLHVVRINCQMDFERQWNNTAAWIYNAGQKLKAHFSRSPMRNDGRQPLVVFKAAIGGSITPHSRLIYLRHTRQQVKNILEQLAAECVADDSRTDKMREDIERGIKHMQKELRRSFRRLHLRLP